MKIAVIYGGDSPESAASAKNAKAIALALKKAGHKPKMLEFSQEAAHRLPGKYDVAFIAAQGKRHGDGAAQPLCGLCGIPYTGTRAAEAAAINNKALCKMVCNHHDVPTAPFLALRAGEYASLPKAELARAVKAQVRFPAVAKPATQGGSFGIAYLSGAAKLGLLEEAFCVDDEVIIEKYIRGTFVTVAVLEVDGVPVALPALTARTAGKGPLLLFNGDFQVQPAQLEAGLLARLSEMTLRLFRVFGARGYARIDYIVDEASGTPYFLEINAVPGLRGKSFFAAAAALAGYDLPSVCKILVEDAKNNHA